MKVTWSQILAWRLSRQFVSAADGGGAVEVARRLCGVQAQVASSARLAVAVRSARPDGSEIERALWGERTLVKTWLMRGGTLHLVPSDQLADYCSALSTLRFWEKGAWLRGQGVTAGEIAAIMDAVPAVLNERATSVGRATPGERAASSAQAAHGKPAASGAQAAHGRQAASGAQGALGELALTREELVEAVVARTGDAHLREALGSGWGALLKPLSRLGELCYGPPRAGKVTFTTPRAWVPGWPGELPPQEEAGVRLVRAFLGAHGPATPQMFDAWLFGGTAPKAVLKGWFRELAPELTEVETDDGTTLLALTSHLDSLAATEPSSAVHLLPGFDQYILGAPRNLAPLLPPELKPKVSRQAGWISPVVVHEGRVAGVWEAKGGDLVTDLAAPVPPGLLDEAVARMRKLLDALSAEGRQES
ncbi:winged helix DNA-binding domain-containing protein [Nonomuraea monospora]|uniref:Winged helix DNA-binding domain-containing protein n=1 Tax=Nonomuraea monospora TaxID=568818 RepID=A0ABP5PXT7_9ACTN